jgi:hypothetical protein
MKKFKVNKVLTAYWSDHYIGSHKLCVLCGNTGVIDTTKSAVSPMGVTGLGRRDFCICPNGQQMRHFEISIMDLVNEGQIIEAINLIRSQTGIQLQDAKAYLDTIREKNIKNQK